VPDGIDQSLDVFLHGDAADVDHDLVFGSQAERRLQLVAIDQRVDPAGIGAVGMITTSSRTCSGKFCRTASLTPTIVVPSSSWARVAAATSGLCQVACMNTPCWTSIVGQVRCDVRSTRSSSPQVTTTSKVASCSIVRESTTCTQRGSHETATSFDRVRKEHDHLRHEAPIGSSHWQRLAIHCSAPPTYSTGVAIATRTGGRWDRRCSSLGERGEIVTTSRLACSCRTWRAKGSTAARAFLQSTTWITRM